LGPVPTWSAKMYGALLIASMYYLIPVALRMRPGELINSRGFGLLAFLFGPFASIAYASYAAGVLPSFLSTWIQLDWNGGVRLKALTTEANILGAFLPILII